MMADRSINNSENDEDDEVPVLVELRPETTETTTLVSSLLREDPEEQPQQQQQEEALPVSPPPPPCPVTILSGFLGSGKTTLIQYILRSPDHGKRIAVIENEYANSREGLSVESLLVRDGSSSESNNALQDLIELPNGCLCCTVKDSLVVTLEQLLLRSDIDAILIECSGLANPGPVAATFWLDAALESRLTLAGIVTVVDAYHIRHQLHDTVEASLQIAYADRILLNKVDLLPSSTTTANDDENDEVQIVEDLIRTLHPTAPLQRTAFAAVPDLDWILNAGLTTTTEPLVLPRDATHNGGHNCKHHHNHGTTCAAAAANVATAESCGVCTGHTLDVSTVSLTVSGSVDLTRMHQWLAALLEEPFAPDLTTIQNSNRRDSGGTVKDDDWATDTLPRPHRSTNDDDSDQQQQIFRIKGILSVQHGPDDDDDDDDNNSNNDDDKEEEDRWTHPGTRIDRRRFIVQAVHDLWDIYPASGGPDAVWDDKDQRTSQLVVIGRHLQGAALQRAFEACRVTVPADK